MPRPHAILLLTVALLLPSRPQAASASSTPNTPTLSQRLHGFLADHALANGVWGVRIDSLDSGLTLFATNDHLLFLPASNAKLFTAALALDQLGPDFRIRTSLHAEFPPDPRGVLRGALTVRGRGDFAFAARFHNSQHSRSLDRLVRAVRSAGISRIDGGLVGDNTFFAGQPWGQGWTWDDLQHYYGAEVSALSAEDNALDLILKPGPAISAPCRIEILPATDYLRFVNRTHTVPTSGPRHIRVLRLPGSTNVFLEGTLPLRSPDWTDAVSVPRPALWFLHLLRDRLRAERIEVRGPLRTLDWPEIPPSPGPRELASCESPPLRELLVPMLKASQNQYAQLLLLQVGALKTPTPGRSTASPDTDELGLEALHNFLTRLGLPPGEVLLDDASGLSRTARVSPACVVELLKAMHRHPHATAFRDALPIAGVDGTLASRMTHTAAVGRLRAKSGALSGVHTLSGYVQTLAGENLVFAILVNGHPTTTASARADLDALGALLASLQTRSEP